MLTYLRHTLATFCFAASVGCLALWSWTAVYSTRQISARCKAAGFTVNLVAIDGTAIFYIGKGLINNRWEFDSRELGPNASPFKLTNHSRGLFVGFTNGSHFPLLYPALIFALADVVALRLGRRFTLRSAIIATTVVAGLLGAAVIL